MRRAILIAVPVLAISCGLAAWHFLRTPAASGITIKPAQVSVDEVERDLCRIATAEQSFFAAAGHYASQQQLQAHFARLGPFGRGQYDYRLLLPSERHFLSVATHLGPLEKRPVLAVIADEHLQVCTVVSQWGLQQPEISDFPHWPVRRAPWGDVPPSYECRRCE